MVAGWSSRAMRAQVALVAGAWFSPSRWQGHDAGGAIAALALAGSVFLPWFNAVVGIQGSSVNGFLIDPPGELAGIAAHRYLWLAFALALAQCGILAARNAPARHARRLPYDRHVVLALSVLVLITVSVACVMKPVPWYGSLTLGDNFYLVTRWTFGAFAALGAAIVSLATSIVAIRSQPRHRSPW